MHGSVRRRFESAFRGPAVPRSFDFTQADGDVVAQHYAFIVSERINHGDGGRGVYWSDPDGHSLEIITRPYGSAR